MKTIELIIWIVWGIGIVLVTFWDKIKRHFQNARENAEKYELKKSKKHE